MEVGRGERGRRRGEWERGERGKRVGERGREEGGWEESKDILPRISSVEELSNTIM